MKRKRICCGFMAFVLAFSLFFCYPVRVVKATALPVEYGVEFVEILYTLMVNTLLGSGVANAASMDYDSAMDLFENFLDGMSQSLIGDYTYIVDGEPATLTLKEDAINLWAVDGSYTPDALNLLTLSTEGTGALVIPDVETWQKFRVVQGGKSGGGSGSPDDQDPFTRIEKIKIGTSCLAYMTAWASNLFSGAMEGIAVEDYIAPNMLPEGYAELPGYYYDGAPVYDFAGYVVSPYSSDCLLVYFLSNKGSIDEYPNFEKAVLISDGKISLYYNLDGKPSQLRIRYRQKYYYNNGSIQNSIGDSRYSFSNYLYYSFNAPVFYSLESMENYFQQLSPDAEGIQNARPLNYKGLAHGLAETFSPLADIEVAPEAVPDVALHVAAAVEPLPEPDPGTDPAENTETYKAAVQAAVEQALPEAVPDPDPDPAPQPGTQFEDIQDYKVDLTMLFPFCLPFDLVHLLEALSADPVAPRFEIPIYIPGIEYDYTLVLDLSMFDDVAAVVRTGELILFVIGLIFATSKLIKW